MRRQFQRRRAESAQLHDASNTLLPELLAGSDLTGPSLVGDSHRSENVGYRSFGIAITHDYEISEQVPVDIDGVANAEASSEVWPSNAATLRPSVRECLRSLTQLLTSHV